jgi:alkylation response protein AidB-like acyl-CoA dehydrogenase
VVVRRDRTPFEDARSSRWLRQGHLGEAVLEGVRVPADNALGNLGDAARMLTLTWNGNRPLVGLAATNLAQRALDKAREYAGIRSQFGKLIGGHQLIQKPRRHRAGGDHQPLLCYYALDCMDRSEVRGKALHDDREQAISMAMRHGAMGISTNSARAALSRDACCPSPTRPTRS